MAEKTGGPLVKLRHLLAGVVVLALLVSAPLLVVWQQVYTRSAAIRRELLTDSLDRSRSEIARLSIIAGRLSATERVEKIARTQLGLEYPSSGRIVIVRPEPEAARATLFDFSSWGFIAAIRRSIEEEKS